MRVLISGGGTGGHVYPALAVAAQLDDALCAATCDQRQNHSRRQDHNRRQPAMASRDAASADPALAAQSSQWLAQMEASPLTAAATLPEAPTAVAHSAKPAEKIDLLWIGSVDGMEQDLVERARIAFRAIDTGKLRGLDPLTVLRSLGRIAGGVRQSLRIIDEVKPQVCFVTGGYVCTSVVIASRLRRIPVLIYLPDMSPGWAIRWLSKLAQRVAVSFTEAAAYFDGEAPAGKAVVTGYPVRQEVVQAASNRSAARRQLADALQRPLAGRDLPLVLVWGGSQGARSINQALWKNLAQVLEYAEVLHVMGVRDWPLYQERSLAVPAELADRYHPVAYLHDEMALALAAADITVSRAGASVLGEYPVARLPSILVPLAGVNQGDNAVLLANRGAALVVADDALAVDLAPKLLNLLQQPQARKQMEQALEKLATPQAALNIAEEIVRLAVDAKR